MNKEEVVQTLIDLGLSTGESKTYVTLITEGPNEATPLAAKAGVTQPKVYDYLKSLQARGFISDYDSGARAKKYEAISYNIVLERLKIDLMKKVEKSKHYFENNFTTEETDERSMVHVKEGKDAVEMTIEDMISKAKKNVLIIDNSYYQDFLLSLKDKYDIEFKIISLTSTPSWLTSLKMKAINRIRKQIMDDIGPIQPGYVAIDVDYASKICQSVAILASPTEETEGFVIVFKNSIIANYQIGFIVSILNSLQERNFIDS